MRLSTRLPVVEVPRYSVKNDLLPFGDCALRYRYEHQGRLAPSRPLQYWPGLFFHGLMEEAYRHWAAGATNGARTAGPDAEAVAGHARGVAKQLAARGLSFPDIAVLGIGLERAVVAAEVWGPILFPAAREVEVRLNATRQVPVGSAPARSPDYLIEGIADLIIAADPAALRRLPVEVPSGLSPDSEAVVDYKSERLPPPGDRHGDAWHRQDWQVLTYAWLRREQPGSRPVGLGLLLYPNELVPGRREMRLLAREHRQGQIPPGLRPSAADADVLRWWHGIERGWARRIEAWTGEVRAWWDAEPGARPFPRLPMPEPGLSLPYRRARAARVVVATPERVAASLADFDDAVAKIEQCVASEAAGVAVPDVWPPCPDDSVCAQCDFRSHCPAPGNQHRRAPVAP